MLINSLHFQEKFQLRLKVVEDTLKSLHSGSRSSELRSNSNGIPRRHSVGGAEISSRLLSSGIALRKSPSTLVRSLTLSSASSTLLKHTKVVSKSFDAGLSIDKDRNSLKSLGDVYDSKCTREDIDGLSTSHTLFDTKEEGSNDKQSDTIEAVTEDFVSGLLYDFLQKEVISLRKACHEKDESLKDKDNAIEV